MARCSHGHSMPDVLTVTLPDSQAGTARHRCAICAYELGIAYPGSQMQMERCSHGNIAPTQLLASLPEYQGGPTRHKCAVCAFTDGVASVAASTMIDTSVLTEDGEQDNQSAVEGAPVLRIHRSYERNRQNRARALLHHGNRCFGCGFSFNDAYTAEHANGHIEIHHIRPLAAGPQIVNPYTDLVPLCANCHRMVHRYANNWLSLEQLRRLLA